VNLFHPDYVSEARMPSLTSYTIQTSSDLATANTIAALLSAFTLGIVAFAIASLRRPPGTKGRKAIATMLFTFGFATAIIALISLGDAAGIRAQRAQLAAGHFTELRGPVTATRLVPFTRHSSTEFLLNQHWFFVPDSLVGSCVPRDGDDITVDYTPADATHAADAILRIRTRRLCR
jgi:hypothetical protein